MSADANRSNAGAQSSRTAGAEASRRVAMIIMAALPLGVTLFAAIALWLSAGGDAEGEVSAVLTRAWMATVIVTVIAAILAWRRMVAPLLPPTGRHAEPPSPDVLRRLQTGLIVCMALVEGGALFGVVVTLIGGGAMPAVIGVLLMLSALVFLWPRPAWYGLRRAGTVSRLREE